MPNATRPSVSDAWLDVVLMKLELVLRVKFRSPGPKAIQLNARRNNKNDTPAKFAARRPLLKPKSTMAAPAEMKTPEANADVSCEDRLSARLEGM